MLLCPITPLTPFRTIQHFASPFCIAGAGAGMAGVLAGQPLDTVRVRLQQRNCFFGGSFWRVAQSLTRREGFGALFKGAAYPLTTTALQVGNIPVHWVKRHIKFGTAQPLETGHSIKNTRAIHSCNMPPSDGLPISAKLEFGKSVGMAVSIYIYTVIVLLMCGDKLICNLL